jgi:hypothetical protein
MSGQRYLVALTEGQRAALLHAVLAARAGPSGGDFTSGDLRKLGEVEPILWNAEPFEVVLGLSRAEADALWSFADQAGDDEDMSSTRPATLAAGRRAMRALTRACQR